LTDTASTPAISPGTRCTPFGELEVFDRTPADQAVECAAGAAIVLTNKTPLPAAVLDQLPDLRYIGVLATGYNVIDIEAAKRQGIVVSNVPTYGTASVAQFVFALLLELCHHVQLHADAVRAGEWTRSPDRCFSKSPLIELEGKTMGIIGYGRIGRQTARSGRTGLLACPRWTISFGNPTSSVSTSLSPKKRAE
jgi:glycerate dehydrogenase